MVFLPEFLIELPIFIYQFLIIVKLSDNSKTYLKNCIFCPTRFLSHHKLWMHITVCHFHRKLVLYRSINYIHYKTPLFIFMQILKKALLQTKRIMQSAMPVIIIFLKEIQTKKITVPIICIMLLSI